MTEAEVQVLPCTDKCWRGLIFASDSKFLRVFIFVNEKCILISLHEYMSFASKLKFCLFKFCEFVFVGPSALLHCNEFALDLQKM